jgi:hypothetical protein
MLWKGNKLETYPEIIDTVLSLKGSEQKKFVEEYAKTSNFALSNIGYIAGYYDSKTAQRILKIFNTEHPIFGRKL